MLLVANQSPLRRMERFGSAAIAATVAAPGRYISSAVVVGLLQVVPKNGKSVSGMSVAHHTLLLPAGPGCRSAPSLDTRVERRP